MQPLFFSSRVEEEKRRDFLLGSRRFRLGETEFYYSYSPHICRLKERILVASLTLSKIRRSLDAVSQSFEEAGRRLREADASAALDQYAPSALVRRAYRQGSHILKFPTRQTVRKNLSVVAGFSIASRFNGVIAISEGLEKADSIAASLVEEDSLIAALVAHFLFEYIHPFERGNGLYGRMRLTESLRSSPYEEIADSLSFYFEQDPQRYFLSFKRSEAAVAHGNLNDYLEAILALIADGAEAECVLLENIAKSVQDELYLLPSYSLTKKELQVGEAFVKMRAYRPSRVSFRSLAKMLGLSERTFYRCLASLQTKGLDMKNALSD